MHFFWWRVKLEFDRNADVIKNTGPYAWVQYVPGQSILPNNPNEGSVKRRNEKKRMRLRREFKLVGVFFNRIESSLLVKI